MCYVFAFQPKHHSFETMFGARILAKRKEKLRLENMKNNQTSFYLPFLDDFIPLLLPSYIDSSLFFNFFFCYLLLKELVSDFKVLWQKQRNNRLRTFWNCWCARFSHDGVASVDVIQSNHQIEDSRVFVKRKSTNKIHSLS